MDDDDGPWWKRALGAMFNQPERFSWRGSSYNGVADRTTPWWLVLLIAAVVAGVAWLGWNSGK